MLTKVQDLTDLIDEYSSEVYSKYQTIAYGLRSCGDCYDKNKVSELSLMIEARKLGIDLEETNLTSSLSKLI